jgi:hypothetical protein
MSSLTLEAYAVIEGRHSDPFRYLRGHAGVAACGRRISLRASIDRKVSCFRSGAIRSPQTMSKIAWATAK